MVSPALRPPTSELDAPRHVAVIMDGNGRWANRKGLGRLLGHAEGYATLKTILRAAGDMGVKFLTVYAFSAENWRRPKEEVSGLMKLIERAAREQLEAMHAANVRVRVAGRIAELPASLRQALQDGIERTKANTGVTFTLAINYGGRAEIVDAVKRLIADGTPAERIDEDAISSRLYHPDHPEPDLMIRTAGEMRWSNFLLWQSAYTELVVTPKAWPEFTPADLADAIRQYQARVRKFGGLAEAPGA